MTDSQIWVTLVGLSSVIIAMLGYSIRTIRAEVGRLDARFDEAEKQVNARFEAVDARFESMALRISDGDERTREVMNARFDDVDHRLGSLEADMALVKAHLIGQRSA